MIMQSDMNLTSDYELGANGEDFGPPTPPRVSRGVMLNEFLGDLINDVLTGDPPPEYQFTETKWGTLALRPKQITGVGGSPNCGKTGLGLQMVTGALLRDPSLRAIIACVEMSEQVLMERTLARLSGVYLTKILERTRDEFFVERINRAIPQLESLADRLMFMQRPFSMTDVRAACDQFEPHIVVLDYLQRLGVGEGSIDMKSQVAGVMTQVRLLADQGPAVLAVAALNRAASSRSSARAESNVDAVNDIAVFRDSSDIEYSLDDAFVLVPTNDNRTIRDTDAYEPKKVVLRHVKSRNNLTVHIPLAFDGRLQEFTLRPWQASEEPTQVVTPAQAAASARQSVERGWSTDNFLDFPGDANGPRPV